MKDFSGAVVTSRQAAVAYDVEVQFSAGKHSHGAIQSQNNIDWKLFLGFPHTPPPPPLSLTVGLMKCKILD